MNINLVKPYNQTTPIFSGKFNKTAAGLSDIFTRKTIDIGSGEDYPADILSNFTESHFTLDGKKINSMEGFLQSLKTPDIEEQEQVCRLTGYQAKKMSHKFKKRPDFSLKRIYWNGKEFDRDSIQFQNLLKKAYEAKYDADIEFRQALNASKHAKLVHTIGKNSTKETILTQNEFVDILQYLRHYYKYKRAFLNLFKSLAEKIKQLGVT